MNTDYVTVIDFGDDVPQKGIGLRIGEEETYGTELIFTHPTCKKKPLGENIEQKDAGLVFLAFRFKTEDDWKNFVNIVNFQNERYNKIKYEQK